MPSVEVCTPKTVFDLYQLLSNEKKEGFLALLASVSNGKVPLLILNKMPKGATEEFNQRCYMAFFHLMMPLVVTRACELLLKHPDSSKEELIAEIGTEIEPFLQSMIGQTIQQGIDKFKAKRDRKSDPKIVRRNVEICDLRKTNRRKWSLSKLASTYKTSVRNISLIIEEEEKWRLLLPPETGSD